MIQESHATLTFSLFDWLEVSGAPLADQLEERLQLLELADQWGFYAYHLAQHEGTPLSLDGSPSVVLASAIQRTERLRLVPTTYCLPWHNPLQLYHEICLLDHYSRGRLEVGVGRGASPIEGAYHGVTSVEQGRERAQEVLDILLSAFRADALTYQGQYFTYDGVELYDKPYQRPYPPLWYPSSNFDTVPYLARHGLHTSHNFAPNAVAKRHFDRYRELYAAHRPDGINVHAGPPRLGNTRHVYVAQTDAQALEEAGPAFALWAQHVSYLSGKFGNRPRDSLTLESRLANGTALVGSPDTVRRQIATMVEETGINYFLGVFSFGNLPFECMASSLRLFAFEVMPAFGGDPERRGVPATPMTGGAS